MVAWCFWRGGEKGKKKGRASASDAAGAARADLVGFGGVVIVVMGYRVGDVWCVLGWWFEGEDNCIKW